MKKLNYLSVSWSILSTVLIFAFALAPLGVFAASTLGTNMSTTGTFTQTVGSATAAQFQNAAGTVTSLIVDTSNNRVGVKTTNPATVFEVQGTASASYFFTINTIQAGGTFAAASVAYSRFGIGTTGYAADVDAANDLLITGALEVDGNTFFDGKDSVSGNFETAGRIRAGTASHSFIGSVAVSSNIVLGTASGSVGLYTAEFSDSAVGTASFLFAGGGTSASTTGTCFQLKDNTGKWVYMSINGHATLPTINLGYVRCHP